MGDFSLDIEETIKAFIALFAATFVVNEILLF